MTSFRIAPIGFVFLFGFCAIAHAADAMRWQDLVAEALKNHPDLTSARENINESSAIKASAASAFFPQIGADASARRSQASGGSSDGGGSSEGGEERSQERRTNSYSYGVGARQLIFDGFKTYSEVEAAAKGIDASRYNYDVVSSNIRLRLRSAYINLLRSQELLGIVREIQKRRRESRDLIQLRYEAGREHRGSLLTAEANLAQATQDVEDANRQLDVSRRRLGRELGRTRFSMLEAQGSLEIVNADPQKPEFDRLAEATPFLQRLIILKEASKWGIRSAQANFFPQVFADGSLGRSGSDWPLHGNEWSIGATFSVPIFEGGNNVAGLSRAKAVYRQSEAEEKSGRDGVLLTLEEKWAAWQDALGQVNVQKKFLLAAVERARIAKSEYAAGLISFNDWIIIENNLVLAEKVYLNARADSHLTEASWMQAKGVLLDEE